ncbi:MAG: T9SS type A sorting domain-containing protein, partial [Bacteroidia bacterium]
TTLYNAAIPGYITSDIFVVEFDTDGKLYWAVGAGGSADDKGNSITTDGNGIIVTGSFSSPFITFGTTTLNNGGATFTSDIFIVKYYPNGTVKWAKRAGGSGNEEGLSVYSWNNNPGIYVTGYFASSSVSFGSTTLVNTGSGTKDIFIAKYDWNGNVIWAKRAGGKDDDEGLSISGLNLCGFFNSATITFGTTVLHNPDSGYNNAFVVRIDTGGNFLWAKSAGGISSATAGFSNRYVTGYFSGDSVMFDSIRLKSAGQTDIFIACYDNTGNVLWAKSAGGKSLDMANDATLGDCGRIYLTGFYCGYSMNFGTDSIHSDSGKYTAFLAALVNKCVSSIAQQPTDIKVISGFNAMFVAKSSAPYSSYQWQQNSGSGFVNLNNASQFSGVWRDTLYINMADLSQNNSLFRCVILHSCCYDTTQVAILKVYCDTTITLQPMDQSVKVGGHVYFSIASSCVSAYYQWEINSGNGFLNLINQNGYGGVKTNSIVVTNISLAQNNYSFRCVVSHSGCMETSDSALLTVIDNTGIEEVIEKNNFRIFPNPVTDELGIRSNCSEKMFLQLFDITGKSLTEKISFTGSLIINLQSFQDGIYLVRITDLNSSLMRSEKVLVKK